MNTAKDIRKAWNKETLKAFDDTDKGVDLSGPFESVEELMSSALNDGLEDAHPYIKQVWDNADLTWKEAANLAIQKVASTMREFTIDDVRDALGDRLGDTHDLRALGAAMAKAKSDGFVRNTYRAKTTKTRTSNGRPVTIWESLIYGGKR